MLDLDHKMPSAKFEARGRSLTQNVNKAVAHLNITAVFATDGLYGKRGPTSYPFLCIFNSTFSPNDKSNNSKIQRLNNE